MEGGFSVTKKERKRRKEKEGKGNREHIVREGDTRGFRDRLLV